MDITGFLWYTGNRNNYRNPCLFKEITIHIKKEVGVLWIKKH